MSTHPSTLKPRRRRAIAAFTLLEIIVLLGIIILLLTLVIPAIWSMREGGRAIACLSNLRQIGVGVNLYLAEHDLTIPTLQSARNSVSQNVPAIDTVLAPYLKSPAVFVCPSDSKIAKATGTSYYWNSALNGQKLGSLNFLKLTADQSQIPLLSDKEGFHPFQQNKVNILYADGHADKQLQFTTER
jgi:prepilin-type processing-associated H-X9-DG protein